MPEMPEVEQVRKTLLPHIKGKQIKKIEVFLPRLIQYPTSELFVKKLTGRKILDVKRRGKYLLLQTDKGTLVVHLRMTGALVVSEIEPTYAKIKFTLSDKVNLWFTDIRTFGTLYYVDDDFVI